jgi:nitrogen regulatory protein PII-like uncharacterized protein
MNIKKISDAAALTNKDWERMQDLIDQGKDGADVAKKITSKDKAIARFVAGLKLEGKEPQYSSASSVGSVPFKAFGNRALELGATTEEINAVYESAVIPEDWRASHKTKKSYTGYTASFDKMMDQLADKYGFEWSKKETREAQGAWSPTTREQYSRNGRVWPLNYEVTMTKDGNTEKIVCILVTNEGGGMYGYDFKGSRMDNFKAFKQAVEEEIAKKFEKVKDSADYEQSVAMTKLKSELVHEGLSEDRAEAVTQMAWKRFKAEYESLREFI